MFFPWERQSEIGVPGIIQCENGKENPGDFFFSRVKQKKLFACEPFSRSVLSGGGMYNNKFGLLSVRVGRIVGPTKEYAPTSHS
jgi:hypothetical protein